MKPTIRIEYCPKCGWMLRAAYMAQELLTTFSEELYAVSLQPAVVSGTYVIYVDDEPVFDRRVAGGFPEIKELKQLIRDRVSPGKSLGHSDKAGHRTGEHTGVTEASAEGKMQAGKKQEGGNV